MASDNTFKSFPHANVALATFSLHRKRVLLIKCIDITLARNVKKCRVRYNLQVIDWTLTLIWYTGAIFDLDRFIIFFNFPQVSGIKTFIFRTKKGYSCRKY